MIVFDTPPPSAHARGTVSLDNLNFSRSTVVVFFVFFLRAYTQTQNKNEKRRSNKKDADGSTYPASAKSASGSRFKFTPRSWKKSSSAPIRGGGVSPAGFAAAGSDALEGNLGSDSDDTDGLDDDDSATDEDIDGEEEELVDTEDEEEESEESDRRSSADAGGSGSSSAGAAAVVVAAAVTKNSGSIDDSGRMMWVLKSGEEAKLEGMDMTQNLRLRVGFAPADGSSVCRYSQTSVKDTPVFFFL